MAVEWLRVQPHEADECLDPIREFVRALREMGEKARRIRRQALGVLTLENTRHFLQRAKR